MPSQEMGGKRKSEQKHKQNTSGRKKTNEHYNPRTTKTHCKSKRENARWRSGSRKWYRAKLAISGSARAKLATLVSSDAKLITVVNLGAKGLALVPVTISDASMSKSQSNITVHATPP